MARRRVRSLLGSVRLLDKWLKENEGKLEDEVRIRRVKRWREEAIEELKRQLSRPGR